MSDPIETIAEVIGGVDYDYEQRDQARSIVIAIRTDFELRRGLWLALTSDNPLSRLSKAPSEAAETTGGDSGTTSYTGVIRGADEADRVATIADLWDVITANGDTNARLMRERDEARAEVVRFADMAADKHGLIHTEAGGTFIQAVCRCGAYLFESGVTSHSAMLAKHIQETNTPHNDPEFGFDKTAALSDPGQSSPEDAECCASGRCEVCSPGYVWGRDG